VWWSRCKRLKYVPLIFIILGTGDLTLINTRITRNVFCVLCSVIDDCSVWWYRDYFPCGCARNPPVPTGSGDPGLSGGADGTDGALLDRQPWWQADVWNGQKHYKVHQKVSLQIAHCDAKLTGGTLYRHCVCIEFCRQLVRITAENRSSLLILCVVFLKSNLLVW
jgi:hypothetical protein